MNPPRVTTRSSAICIALLIFGTGICLGEKLSPDQKAPPFARGSGGLILKAPFEGEQARGQPAASTNIVDGVQRQETEMLKLVDGQLVRVVEGSFAYKSPEGLPISVKYVADENGNRASFKFGTGVSSGGPGTGGRGPGTGGRDPGASGQTGPAGQTGPGQKSSTYLPPNNVDRSYLPPQ